MATYDVIDTQQRAPSSGLLEGGWGGLLSQAGKFLASPAGQGLLAGGLGYAASVGRRGAGPWNTFGAAGLAGLQGYTGAIDQQQEAEQGKVRRKLWDAQLTGLETKNQADLLQLNQQRERADFWKNGGRPSGPGVGMAASDSGGFSDGNMGLNSITGGAAQANLPTPGALPPLQPPTAGGFQMTPYDALRLGYSVQEAKDLAQANNWGRSKVGSFHEVRQPDGQVRIVGFDEFGAPVNTGQQPWKAPEVRDFGGYFGGIDLITGDVTNYGRKTMSPAEIAQDRRARDRNAIDRDRLDYDRNQPRGQIIQTDQGFMLADNRSGQAVPMTGPGGAPLTPKLREIPAAQNTAIIENGKALSNIDDAIAEVTRSTGYTIDAAGNVKRIKGAKTTAPDALGGWNYLPDFVRQRTDSEGVPLRAKLANIATGKYHDISGAAVTASEAERLRPFVPATTDTPEVVLKKLHNMRREYQGVNDSLMFTYSREQGYRPSPTRAPVGGNDVPHDISAILKKHGVQ